MLDSLMGVSPADEAAEKSSGLKDHVIIGGYGLAGRDLASALKKGGQAYVIVELNPENIRLALSDGEPAYYGDITSPDVLEKLDIAHAAMFVIVINDPNATKRAIAAARKISGEVYILVRTTYLNDVAFLKEAGASDVVANELISSTEITARVLKKRGVNEEIIEGYCAEIVRQKNQN